MNVQRSEAKFDLDIEQYVSCMKNALKSASSQITKPIKPIAPISCTIPDSPKYKGGKPIPFNKRYVTVSGFLSDIMFKEDISTGREVERFKIEVDNMVFLGQYVPTATPTGTGLAQQCEFSLNASHNRYFI